MRLELYALIIVADDIKSAVRHDYGGACVIGNTPWDISFYSIWLVVEQRWMILRCIDDNLTNNLWIETIGFFFVYRTSPSNLLLILNEIIVSDVKIGDITIAVQHDFWTIIAMVSTTMRSLAGIHLLDLWIPKIGHIYFHHRTTKNMWCWHTFIEASSPLAFWSLHDYGAVAPLQIILMLLIDHAFNSWYSTAIKFEIDLTCNLQQTHQICQAPNS